MESKNAVQEKIDPDRWIIQVRDNLQIEEEDQEELSVSVFNVPTTCWQLSRKHTPRSVFPSGHITIGDPN
ncbi:hypothetical protein SUGI_0720160 [Cryptomeria japonica]|nr:hypothetical protein SUGI_0720160 [Cryptomeria japonica]